MGPELIVVNGPQAGTRYRVDRSELWVGRAPGSNIVLSEPEVGWRHCQVRQQGGRFLVTDLKTSLGTYVNGMRSAERWLEDKDQIGIGRTILMFRSGDAAADETPASAATDTKPVLLAACSLVFLFRALAASAGQAQNQLLETQILQLVSDLIPIQEGVLLLASSCAELSARYAEKRGGHNNRMDLEPLLARVCEEGAVEDAALSSIGVPLYLSGVLGGALVLRVQDQENARLTAHLDTLTAIASLASIGFEANQEVETLKAERALLKEEIAVNTGIVGNSPAIRRVLDRVEKIAPRDTTVLITGESGTGKELIARALHQRSSRREFPFIAFNCAAFNENLFESELFGHDKGAFSGAIALKRGRFELAQGGTIFFDEIGELPYFLQPKLLRVLQDRVYERVGGTQSLKFDVRVIAATNRDLTEEVRASKFREDLFHRFNVINIESPPLRERKEDIPVLAQYFLQRISVRVKRHVQGFSREAEEMMMQYHWPGNVRELENAIERAVVLGDEDLVIPDDLPEALLETAPPDQATGKYHSSVRETKKEAIIEAYVQARGDYKQAAKLLDLHPNYLLRLVRNLGLRDEINRRLEAAGIR
ncbi:MAG: sigma 54-interacting transcriptional regulator [Acidobacteriaceae bacterium]|nr:sigma 54-interacting transcriptional regulator [Acidobacteriaceae bacterium]